MSSDEAYLRLYNPPTQCGDSRCREVFPELIYCVVIPCGVLFVFVLVVTIVMCVKTKACGTRKYKPLDTSQSGTEMESYNSIRRASATLRQMSHNRDTPLMGSRACSMTLDRAQRRHHRKRDSCGSAPGTLQRNRQRRSELQAEPTGSSLNYPPGRSGSEIGLAPQSRPGYSRETSEAPSPPPPYSFIPSNVMQLSTHSSITNGESSDPNSGSGAQPLLHHQYHHHHQHPYRTRHSNSHRHSAQSQ